MRPGRTIAAVLVAVAVLITACSGDDAPNDESPNAEQGPPTTDLPLAEGQTPHPLNVRFQYGAFEVTIGDTVYDANRQQLLLGLRFTNLGNAWSMPETQVTLEAGGTETPVFGSVVDIPPRMSADLTWTIDSLSADPAPDGVLRWGRPDRDQPVIKLDGTTDNTWRPVDVELDGRAGLGKYSVHVTGATILAASPESPAQPDPGQRVLRMVFDQYAFRLDPVNGFYPVEHLTLRRPDGETVEAISSTDGFAPVSWSAVAGNTIDFPIAADFAGDYELLLSSLSPKGLSTLRPDLIDRVAIPITLGDLDAPSSKLDGDDLAARPLPDLSDPTVEDTSLPVDVAVAAGTMNVGGFIFEPERFRWDPTSATTELDGTVRSIETATPTGMEDLVKGLLDVPPQFSFTFGLASRGRFFTGIVSEQPDIGDTESVPVTIEFLSVDRLDPDDLGLIAGPRTGAPSSMPLTAGSAVVAYPPEPVVDLIASEPVSAGDWTVKLEGYRIGMVTGTTPPPPGRLELEVLMSVTAAPDATVRSLGLSFRPSVQVFLAGSDGYLQQPVEKNELVFYEPGETKRQSVVFQVPDSFRPGPLSFVLRGADESTEVTIDEWIETTFAAQLTDASAGLDPGGL